ncbi:LPXTG cell wall anchor domain-containing protein [uncultured Arcanobacterium sp.]|uniref:LPXTG cell wall anchor domain-containing protein n=1 Tax=uncultured Arcanobacterium sp. TaxID=487520 RepID=UPI0026282ED1|nr:LPXTG cell wall anchor domain-containing protein [uncultured Arcanobacterium sp.]
MMRKKNGIRFIAAGSMGLLLALGISTSSIADVNAGSSVPVTNTVKPGADPAANNLHKTENYVNSDLSVLPDNVNWDGSRKGVPDTNTFDEAVKLPNTATPYSIVDMQKVPGVDEPLITNAKEFGWDLNMGAISISKEGKAFTNGTGESGIINPENKKNIFWFGKYRKNAEPETKKDENTASIAERAWEPWVKANPGYFEGAKKSIATGEYCKLIKQPFKTQTFWEKCDSPEADKNTKQVFADYSAGKIGIHTMLARADLKNGTHLIFSFDRIVYPRFNSGVKQAVDVTPGSEIVITPSWVSNGNKDGTDQLRLRIYDATGKQISDYPDWNTDRPKMLYDGTTNRPEVGTQGFVWKVPEGVTRIFTTFRQADETKDHTGLENKSAVALTGFTGATVTTGSHLTMSNAASNDASKQVVNKPFDFSLEIVNDGFAATANGEFSATLPAGVTAKAVSLLVGDKEIPGTIKDGKITVPLGKIEVGQKVVIKLHGLVLPDTKKWNLENPQLAYNTFALNGGYTDAAKFQDSFHIVHPYEISLMANEASSVNPSATGNGASAKKNLPQTGAQMMEIIILTAMLGLTGTAAIVVRNRRRS